MDATEKPVSEDGHPAVYGSHVGMIVSPVEKMTRTVLLRYDSKNAAHGPSLNSWVSDRFVCYANNAQTLIEYYLSGFFSTN
ncbi:MAG: hypothetical protein A4E63_00084 [Syntrophorhabdus sp. PtaU1.Bin050]|nr:MAG: hypothetical protein A4E63_00084 [Syntrophorhabdus sp. PtaU1.Bin050]